MSDFAVTRNAQNVGGAKPALSPPERLGPSIMRIGAMIRRYVYLLRSSGVRVLELVYGPFLQMLTWGFLQRYLANTPGPLARGAGVLIGSVLLWEILFRCKIGFSTTFIEEMWARNLGNLLTTPLRPYELLLALSVWSLMRVIISITPVAIAAYFIFGFNVLYLGLPLVAFFSILMITSFSLGLIAAGIILGHGLGAWWLAWSLAVLLMPICCVFYPVTVLPESLQPIALILPPTHVFEGMRAILLHNAFEPKQLWLAAGLSVLYLFVGYFAFSRFLAIARVKGTLLRLGE
jgi:ABC-2 type transport system permease protein